MSMKKKSGRIHSWDGLLFFQVNQVVRIKRGDPCSLSAMESEPSDSFAKGRVSFDSPNADGFMDPLLSAKV